MQKYRLDFLFILIILIAVSAALFFKIGETPPPYPWSDESEIAADAVDTLKRGPQLFYPGQLAGGSLAVWLEAGWMALFGKELVGLRLLNGLVNLVSALLLYLLVRQLPFEPSKAATGVYGRWLGLMAGLFLAVSTWLLGLGRIAAPNWSLVPLMIGLAFYLFWLGLTQKRRLYLAAAGAALGLLIYGYIPGYFGPLVPILFLILAWRFADRQALAQSIDQKRPISGGEIGLAIGYLTLPALLAAAPMLIFFALNPEAALQRPLQLAGTSQVTAGGALGAGTLDMLSTFGLFPNWLFQGKFEHLAFDPLVTVLFVIGLLAALRRWRQPAYLFLLVWWGVMILPALLSRSASLGFIFEVWRRGIGAQPVSFILAATGALSLTGLLRRSLLMATRLTSRGGSFSTAYSALFLAGIIIVSAGLSYWLYFGRWANSSAIPNLFAAGPVRLVEWMEAEGQADTLFLFPIRPNVSPTTRPELFTVRYLYAGPARMAFPEMVEPAAGQTLPGLPENRPARVKLMMSDRIEVDPKGYFEYALAHQGEVVSRQTLPDYVVTTYRLRPEPPVETRPEPVNVTFGPALRLVEVRLQPPELAAGQTLGAALRWARIGPQAVDYNARLTLYDAHDFEQASIDKPLLSSGDYLTSGHWAPGLESTLYYALPIPPDTPPGSYTLRVVAYEAESGAQLPPAGGQADLSLSLAAIELAPNPNAVDPATLAVAQPIEAQFPGGLRLIGLESSAGPTNRPGDRLRVTLLWQAAAPPTIDVGLMLALAAPGSEPVPLSERPRPLIEGYPTTEWPAGHIYRVNYPFSLPAALAGGDYQLALRLVDLANAEPLAEQFLAPISIEARAHVFQAPALAHEVNVDFGRAIRLRSFDLEPFSPEQPEINLKLQWQARQEMPDSYKIFLHLIDGAGQIVGQVDALPRQGAAPTRGWLAGEIIEDELRLTLPDDISPGTYRLIVGLYDEKSGERLLAGPDDHVILIEQALP